MRVHGAVEFHIEGNAGIIWLQPDAMAAQAFQYGDGKRADGGGQRVGPKAARGAEVPLPAGNRDAGKSVHDIAVGVVTKAYVKDDVAAGHRVAGVPEALHPRRVTVVNLVESGRKLVADEVVLWCQHGLTCIVWDGVKCNTVAYVIV